MRDISRYLTSSLLTAYIKISHDRCVMFARLFFFRNIYRDILYTSVSQLMLILSRKLELISPDMRYVEYCKPYQQRQSISILAIEGNEYYIAYKYDEKSCFRATLYRGDSYVNNIIMIILH